MSLQHTTAELWSPYPSERATFIRVYQQIADDNYDNLLVFLDFAANVAFTVPLRLHWLPGPAAPSPAPLSILSSQNKYSYSLVESQV